MSELKELWGGAIGGLIGEVETSDCYQLKRLDFVADLVLDCGGNVGVFARFARKMFPDALIVSIEPHKANCEVYKEFTKDKNTILIEKAIGIGNVWRDKNASNGAGENYISDSVGYPKDEMINDERMELMETETIMIDELIDTYLKDGMKSILKLDIEAGENVIWTHKPSMNALKKIDYICCELHRFGLHGGTWQDVQDKAADAIKELEETHVCIIEGVHLWATEKSIYKPYVPPPIIEPIVEVFTKPDVQKEIALLKDDELWNDFNKGKVSCSRNLLSDTITLLFKNYNANRTFKCGNIIFQNTDKDFNIFTWKYNTEVN